MIRIADRFLVARPVEEVYRLFERFDAIGRCLPTLKSFEVRADGKIDGKVGVTLGAIPVESRVQLEIVRREPPRCIAARGISYMGETIEGLRDGRKVPGVDEGAVGQLYVHFDFRPRPDGSAVIAYETGVEAEGRLRKIYEAIIRSKVPAFQREFREKLARALSGAELHDVPEGFELDPCEASIQASTASGGVHEQAGRERWPCEASTGAALAPRDRAMQPLRPARSRGVAARAIWLLAAALAWLRRRVLRRA